MQTTDADAKVVVLTTMNRRILATTGRKMLTSVIARWPVGTVIAVAFEGTRIEFASFRKEWGEHISCFDMIHEDTALTEWMDEYRRHPGQDSFKRCAWRFAYKSFAVTGVGMDLGADVLVWLDADTYTHRDIPSEELGLWLPYEKRLAFLGRANNISECGFVMYDLRQKTVRSMLHEWRGIYVSGKLFDLEGWTDCHVFDYVRTKWIAAKHWENLTPWGKGWDHVFINGPLGAYMDHMKGTRKRLGRSRVRDIITERVTPEFLEYMEQ